MTRYTIDRDWMIEKNKEIEKVIAGDGKIEHITSFAKGAAWLVKRLVQEGIAFKCHNMGAGVKKITTDVKSCPMCGGYIKGKRSK